MSQTMLTSDIGLLLLRDRRGDRDLLRGRCTKDLRESKKFDEPPGCCAKQSEFEDGGLESCDESIIT